MAAKKIDPVGVKIESHTPAQKVFDATKALTWPGDDKKNKVASVSYLQEAGDSIVANNPKTITWQQALALNN